MQASDENIDSYDIEDDVMEQGEDWTPHQKRPRYADDFESPRNSSRERGYNGYYRGSVNLMLPQNGRRTGAELTSQNIAYQVLVQSIKQELASALEKVAEKSAKRILVELHKGSVPKTNDQTSDNADCARKEESDRLSSKKQPHRGEIDLIERTKMFQNSTRFADDGK